MIEQVRKILEIKGNLNRNDKLIVGVSGGADSLVLLNLLFRLQWNLTAVHFNHRLRSSSDEEEEFVESYCRENQIEFRSRSIDVGDYVRREKENLEQAARELRYRFLYDVAEQKRAAAVLVAHNADDQVETVLMHLIRGSGLKGLVGMREFSISPWHPTIPLVRPLLNVWRKEIETYCITQGLKPRFDESNQDTDFLRNRLRYETIPLIAEVESSFKEKLIRMSAVLSADLDLLIDLTRNTWTDVLDEIDDQQVVLDRIKLIQQPIGLQRRLIRKAMEQLLGGLEDVGFEVVDRALNAAKNPPPTRQIDLVRNLRLIVDSKKLILSRWGEVVKIVDWVQLPDSDPIQVGIPDQIQLSDHWVFTTELVDRAELPETVVFGNPDPLSTFMDADVCGKDLTLRTRMDGDRYQPLGMEGKTIKVSDLMINAKLPKLARDQYPIVVGGEIIIWVPGFQPSNHVKVTSKTKKILKISVTNEEQ